MHDQQLSPAEVSRLLGISPKALRLYEARGLVKPARGLSGWRVFGREQIERLHTILALKALRLPLADIARLMQGGRVTLAGVLEIHERALPAEAKQARRALTLIRTARSRLAAGDALSIDDLATLSKETTMPSNMNPTEIGRLLEPHVQLHFSQDEIDEAARRPFDQQGVSAGWEGLIAEAKALMAIGDPTSPAALDLARRWKAELDKFTLGDPAIAARVGAVWTDAMADPQAAPQLPLTPAMFTFIDQANASLAEGR